MELRYPFSYFFDVIVKKATGARSMDAGDEQSETLDRKKRDLAAVERNFAPK